MARLRVEGYRRSAIDRGGCSRREVMGVIGTMRAGVDRQRIRERERGVDRGARECPREGPIFRFSEEEIRLLPSSRSCKKYTG